MVFGSLIEALKLNWLLISKSTFVISFRIVMNIFNSNFYVDKYFFELYLENSVRKRKFWKRIRMGCVYNKYDMHKYTCTVYSKRRTVNQQQRI